MSTQLSDFKSRLEFIPDRRWQPRFHVNGSAVLETGEGRFTVRPMDLGLGGILFLADRVPPVDSTGELKLDVYGYGEMIYTNVQVIQTSGNLVNAIFVSPEPSVARCVAWLTSWSRKTRKDR